MKKSLINLCKSLGFAANGVVYVMAHENNMRIHVLASFLVILMGFYFGISNFEWIAIVFCIGLVWCAEIFNTSVEVLVNIVSPKFNAKAGLVKDIAAGGVLVAAAISMVIGAIIFLPKF